MRLFVMVRLQVLAAKMLEDVMALTGRGSTEAMETSEGEEDADKNLRITAMYVGVS